VQGFEGTFSKLATYLATLTPAQAL
jgi:hypothetical protein